jgi:hypothetical protein
MRTIAVALAVAFFTAGGASAAFVVTSKQIKDGTIQLRDLSPAVRQLGRPTQRVVVREFVAFSYASTGPKSVMAACPLGTVLLGGGFTASADGPPARIIVSESAPTPDLRGWKATGDYVNPNLLAALYVYALCAKS